MKSKKEILDEFGKLLISEVYDGLYNNIGQVISGEAKKYNRLEKYSLIFDKINNDDKRILKEYFETLFEAGLFNFLKIFEENEEYKLIYETSGKQVNLEEISEMLKAEIHGEDGWIARYSSFMNNASNS